MSFFHTFITKQDSDELDRIQAQALRSIYGWRLSYNKLLEKSGLDRLDIRGEAAFLSMAKKFSASKRFS